MSLKKILASFLSVSLSIGFAVSTADASESTPLLGDADMNYTIDSADASLILSEYSTVSTGGNSIISSSQKICADVDKNNMIDSIDASHILAYYAYTATGGTASITEFLKDEQQPVTTTATTTTTAITTTTTAPATQPPATTPPPVANTYITNGFTEIDTGEWYPSNSIGNAGFSIPNIVFGDYNYRFFDNGTWEASTIATAGAEHVYVWGYDGSTFYIDVDPWWIYG